MPFFCLRLIACLQVLLSSLCLWERRRTLSSNYSRQQSVVSAESMQVYVVTVPSLTDAYLLNELT